MGVHSEKQAEQGKRMYRIRERLGLSPSEWGKALGYSGSEHGLNIQIRRFELGHRPIPIRTWRLALMFDAYGIPTQWR